MDSTLLRSFIAVVDTGRISAAARQMHVSQPAMTAQMHRLEESVGRPLLVRSARGVTLTPAGERLVEHARQVEAMLTRTRDVVGAGMSATEELRLAASTTIAAYVLPGLLRDYRRVRPESPIALTVANTTRVIDAVSRGVAALGLVEGLSRAPGVRLTRFMSDQIVALAAPRLAELVQGRASLAAQPFLWREQGSGTRAVVERMLRRAKLRARPTRLDVTIASTEALLNAAAAGLGVTFASRLSAASYIERGALVVVPYPGLSAVRALSWVVPASGLSDAAARFHTLAESRRADDR